MELDNINHLLEKYFEGETSLAEEAQLQDYFASADVAPELEHYRPLFGYFAGSRDIVPEREIILPGKKKGMNWIPAAASVILLLGAGTFAYFNYGSEKPQDLGTYDDPELAYQQTQKALEMLSHHVNSGVKGIEYINTYEQSKNVIFKK